MSVQAVEWLWKNGVEVLATAGRGLDGDRYAGGGKRQLTLIQEEHLYAVGFNFGSSNMIDPALTRRNVVVKGINLLSLKGKVFRIGDAIAEYTGECHPCSRMEDVLGVGGYNAMRGHGGIISENY